MKKNKKNIIKNFSIGLFSQLIIIVLGLVVPRVVLLNYGSDANGLINCITQIFTYLALFEAGISQAATNAIFKPLKENDNIKVSNVVFSAQYQFRRISVIYGLFVLGTSFVIPLLIKTSVSYWTIFGIVIFEGLTNVVSFYFINSWTCLLNADGHSYVVNAINFIGRILCYAIKIILALLQVNIVLIEVGYFVISLVKLLFFYLYMKKNYQWLNKEKKYGKVTFPDRRYYLITEISSAIFQSTDIIIISIFLSTSSTSVYSVYNLVFASLSTLLNAAFVSITYVLNQTYIRDIDAYRKAHDIFTSFFVSIMCILSCVAYFLIVPFVSLYTNGVNDIDYINQYYPLLFCSILLISWSRYVPNNLMGISGYAQKNAVISIIEASVNIIISICLINHLGIIGVLIGTIVSLPIRVIYLNLFCDHFILKRNCGKTMLINGVNYLVFIVTVMFSSYIGPLKIGNYLDFVKYGVILVIIYSMIVIPLNLLVNKDLIRFVGLIKKKGD